ncbi:helix-turn-helix domain-containing protein [Pleomorphochaeta sp. DL1XJH-081]|uniref:helix-turn-helix domain-containing protein n=1 Tax=Pleomorphochaeta sp. DL1XJH-081 TaxID=3409690 RepID=UPI003BB62B9C
MKHVILLTYSIIFSTGFGALAALLVLSIRLKQPFTKRMAVVQSLFIASLALVAIYYYLMQVLELVGPKQEQVENVFGTIGTLLNMGLYIGMWWILGIRELRKGHISLYARISCLGSVGIMASALIGSFLPTSFLHTMTPRTLWQIFVYLTVAVTLLLFGLTLVRADMKQQHGAYRLLVHGIGYCSLAFVPLSLLELLLNRSTQNSLYPLSLEYLFYLGINVIVLVSSIRSLAKDPNNASAFGTINESAWSRFSLTAREREMATLIAQGLSNKEIAGNLGISEATVRTHIYNLFQKVGAQSRIELLNLLHD